MPLLIALKLFAGNALSAAWKWLGGLTFWQLITLGLAAFALVQHFQLAGERRHSAKVESQLAKATDQLRSISTKRNVQHDVTERTVVRVERGDPVVRTIVRTIHDAPNPPGCATPGLNTVRGVL